MSPQVRINPELLEWLKNPIRLSRDLQTFRKTARALSSNRPRLIHKYPNEWVAIHSGKVVAHGRTFNSVLKKMKRKNIPLRLTIVRYIEKNRRTLIL